MITARQRIRIARAKERRELRLGIWALIDGQAYRHPLEMGLVEYHDYLARVHSKP